MSKTKEYSFFDKKKNGKKKIIAIALIGLIILSIGIGIFFFQGSLVKDISYDYTAEIGDKYYFKIADKYYKGDSLKEEFAMILKQEILDKKDSELDLDDDKDLFLLSTLLLGEDIEMLGQEFGVYVRMPNYLDIANLLMMGYNIYKYISYEKPLEESLRLVTPDIPSATHLVTTGIYHEIDDLTESFGLDDINVENLSFENLYDTLKWFRGIMDQVKEYEEDFEGLDDGGSGYDINLIKNNRLDNWTYQTLFPENNSALLSKEGSDWGIRMFQDSNASLYNQDDLKVQSNLYDFYLPTTNWSDWVGDKELRETYFEPSELSFDLERSELPHTFEVNLQTNPFNISGSLPPKSYNFTGVNGLKFRIKNGIPQYKVGDYYWDGNNFIETISIEKGWHNTDVAINISEYTTNDFNLRFNLDFNSFINFPLLTDDNESFTYDVYIGDEIIGNNLSLYMDCPFDFAHAYNWDTSELDYLFRPFNLTDLIFKVYDSAESSDSQIDNWFDDLIVNGFLFADDQSFDMLMDEWLTSQFLLISIFHTMLYPKQFNWDTIHNLLSLLNMLLELITTIQIDENGLLVFEEGSGIEDPIKIQDDTNQLRVEIPSFVNITLSLLKFFLALEERNYNLEFKDYPCKKDFTFILNFDKRIGTLNQSKIVVDYLEYNVKREIEFSLFAVSDKEGVAKYEGVYPSFDDLIESQVDKMSNIIIIGLVSTALITAGSSIGIVEIIHYIRRRKKRKGRNPLKNL
jgi:hypothetical protein